ncbi:MAG TPA: DUF423 domain-containing protein [Azospirillum sp.]
MGIVGRVWLVFAGMSGGVAVAAGAYATHALAAPGQEHAQELARMAGQYQLWHALALIAVAVLAGRSDGAAGLLVRLGGWLFVAGTLLFCGTLYAQALGNPAPFAMSAPMGGSALILGWVCLGASALLPGWARRY